ncbi:hypothetical protein KR093_008957 [Drosophila rubida]|uniref:Uncharacterized protein n=1 Tax=Drosophila rubida TaxID=30044 RepID=A0AAD4PPV4_9MUSC|nr:hypothetical protein KR093_008957 [Drosophila rubida]
MKIISLGLLIACSFAWAEGANWRINEDYIDSDEYVRPRWTHRHSEMWPCDVADYPAAYLLIHKVEQRLYDINNEQMRNNIVDYVVNRLRKCKSDGQMDEHCVKRSIGYAMSFINRHQIPQQF